MKAADRLALSGALFVARSRWRWRLTSRAQRLTSLVLVTAVSSALWALIWVLL